MKSVKFLQNKTPYMKGEVAIFQDSVAEALIDRRIAMEVGAHTRSESERLKHISEAARTRHIPGPENTKANKPAGTKSPRRRTSRKSG